MSHPTPDVPDTPGAPGDGPGDGSDPGGQPTLPGLVREGVRQGRARSRARTASEVTTAPLLPVARVLVDTGVAHLDRPFDYLVPADADDRARPGVRVKVRFAGRDVDGYLLERLASSEHPGRLAHLRRVVSDEPVLGPAVAGLAADVARRWAGTRWDVVRLAVPPRHAAVEARPSPHAPVAPPAPGPGGWSAYERGALFVEHLATGGVRPRAVWSVAPGEDWPDLLARAAAATLAAGRGTIICVPDGRDVARVSAALGRVLGPDQHVELGAGAGPSRRYRDFLAVSRGTRRVVVGTRSAALAPVHDLGLVVCWDDGDDLHAEPRAPYPHTRDLLLLRAEREGTAALVGGFARTVEAGYLVSTGWAVPLQADRATVRARVGVEVAGGEHDLARDPHATTSRFPQLAHRAVRDALAHGPVLVQTPRRGYAAALACERCRHPARCPVCTGPLALGDPLAPPTCRWCGHAEPAWACPVCGAHGLRAPVLGESRTAEELGRAFPGVPVRTSAAGAVLAEVAAAPALVVATPGAEPVAEGGYAAVVLLDTWAALGRVDLRAEEEALRRWCNAVGLVRPGGRAVAVGDPAHPVLQALVRWDPAGFAERETAARLEAHLPPASRLATLSGSPGAVDDALALLPRPEGLEVLGPVPLLPAARGAAGSDRDGDQVRAVVRVPRSRAGSLSTALLELQRVRSTRKLDPVRVQVDPQTL